MAVKKIYPDSAKGPSWQGDIICVETVGSAGGISAGRPSTHDNNAAENCIRPFVVGRKNWLFSGTPEGAAASAVLYSLVESAKANGLEPYSYFRYIFEKLPVAETLEDLEALLPWNLNRDKLLREVGVGG